MKVARRVAALAAVLALALARPATAQQDPSDGAHLAVVSQSAWVVPGGAFALRLRVEDPPDGATLRVRLHDRVTTRSGFVRSLTASGLRRVLVTKHTAALDAPIRLVTGSVTGEPVDVTSTLSEGVYPVVVDLLDGDGGVADRVVTHLVRLPAPGPDTVPLNAVVAVPLHATPSHAAPGDIDPAPLARLRVTVDALLERPGVDLLLIPTPEALAGLAEADPAAADRLAEVAGGRTVVARPWVRVDEVAWRAGGLRDELERQYRAGRAAIAATLGTEPTDAVALLPSGDGPAAAEAAVDRGARLLLVPEADLEPLDERDFPVTLTRPFEVEAGDGTVPALMIDAGLAAHIGATGDSVLDAHRLLADLAVLALDNPAAERVAVVALTDRAAADPAFLGALLGGLDQPPRAGAAPLVRASAPQAAAEAVEPAERGGDTIVRDLLEGEDPPSVGTVRDDLGRARDEVASYRSVFGDDDPLAADFDELVLTSASLALDTAERSALLAGGLRRLTEQLQTISPPPDQTVTLTARDGQIQLVLTNASGRPANVNLALRGDRLEFPGHEDGRLLVNLIPETTRIDLAVRARSSGDAPLDLRVLSPDGRLELGQSRIVVRATAVSGVGLVLMGAAALFLVVWWTRTILRERGAAVRRHPAHAAKE